MEDYLGERQKAREKKITYRNKFMHTTDISTKSDKQPNKLETSFSFF